MDVDVDDGILFDEFIPRAEGVCSCVRNFYAFEPLDVWLESFAMVVLSILHF